MKIPFRSKVHIIQAECLAFIEFSNWPTSFHSLTSDSEDIWSKLVSLGELVALDSLRLPSCLMMAASVLLVTHSSSLVTPSGSAPRHKCRGSMFLFTSGILLYLCGRNTKLHSCRNVTREYQPVKTACCWAAGGPVTHLLLNIPATIWAKSQTSRKKVFKCCQQASTKEKRGHKEQAGREGELKESERDQKEEKKGSQMNKLLIVWESCFTSESKLSKGTISSFVALLSYEYVFWEIQASTAVWTNIGVFWF